MSEAPKVGDRVIGVSGKSTYMGILRSKECPFSIQMNDHSQALIYEGSIHPAPDAPTVLERSAAHIRDRAAQRDQADGERSMLKCIRAFNGLTGHALSERDGWLFMVLLKGARACASPSGVADDYEDMAAYAALAGECAAITRAKEYAND